MAKIICAKNFFLEGLEHSTWAKHNIRYLGHLHHATECKTLNIWPKYRYLQDFCQVIAFKFCLFLAVWVFVAKKSAFSINSCSARSSSQWVLLQSKHGPWAHGLSRSSLCAIFLKQGIHREVPALAGGSLTTDWGNPLWFLCTAFLERILLVKYYFELH